jgi:hypothetical protein
MMGNYSKFGLKVPAWAMSRRRAFRTRWDTSPAPMTRPDWLWLSAFCLLGLLIRLAVAWTLPGFVHPDEIFQYDEQAHRLLHGTGLVPWEFLTGARSWLLPALLAAVMWAAGLVTSAPDAVLGVIATVMAAAFVPTIAVAFLWGRRAAGLAGGIAAAGLNACWFETVYFSVHPMSDTIAAALLAPGLYLCSAGTRRRCFWAGVLLGATVAVRLQLAPAGALCALAACGLQPRRWLPLLAGAAIPVTLSGLLDWVTWSAPFHSYFVYLRANIGQGTAAAFGTSPWYAYIGYEMLATWGIMAAFGLLAVLVARQLPLPAIGAIAIVATFSLVGHKEARFIYPALPLVLTLAGAGAAMAGRRLADLPGRGGDIRTSLGCTGAAAALSVLIGTFGPFSPRWHYGGAVLRASRVVNDDPAACGVGVYPATLWYLGGGYTSLRPGITLSAAREGTAAFNYVMAIESNVKPLRTAPFADPNFQPDGCFTDPVRTICLWRRTGGCDPGAATPIDTAHQPVAP